MANPTGKGGEKAEAKGTEKAADKGADKPGEKVAEKSPDKGAGKGGEKGGDAADRAEGRRADGAAPGEGRGAPTPRVPKAKRGKRVDAKGVAHVKASFNNTLVTITTNRGEVISVGSAGTVGFKGTRKSTPFAAQRAAEQAAAFAMRHGLREVEVLVKGAGSGRESAVRALSNSGLKVISIEDVTPLPHNGCRARKRRRV
jgi:small subunit ribosomal protein S11